MRVGGRFCNTGISDFVHFGRFRVFFGYFWLLVLGVVLVVAAACAFRGVWHNAEIWCFCICANFGFWVLGLLGWVVRTVVVCVVLDTFRVLVSQY